MVFLQYSVYDIQFLELGTEVQGIKFIPSLRFAYKI